MIRRLWIRFLLLYLVVVLLAICVASLYAHYQLRSYFVDNLEGDLFRTARALAALMDVRGAEGSLDELCRQLKEESGYRVTVIDPDGIVLGDSDRDSSTMENHLYRPEVQEALDKGSGTAIRFSHTVGYPMLYGAILVSPGPSQHFIRLSVPLEGVFAELSKIRATIVQGSLLAFFVAIPVVFLFSRRMSQRIGRITAFIQVARKGEAGRRLFVGSQDELGVLEKELDAVAEEMNEQVRELASERTRLDTILGAIQDGIILVDAQDQIVFLNPYAREIIGPKNEPVIGSRLMEVMRSDELYGLVREAREDAESPEPREVFFLGNPERPFMARARGLRDSGGMVTGDCLILLRDITERKRLEKVRADFLSRVSHELRTPLTLIKGFVETLQDEGFRDSQETSRYLSVIEENTDRLARLVGDLVRLSSIELGRLPVRAQAVRLNDLIDGAVQSFEVRAKDKGLELIREIPEELPCVMADPDRLTEILFNLLDNAIKFTPQGEIRVSATSGVEVDQSGGRDVPVEVGRGGDDRPQFLYVPPGGGSPVESVIVKVEDTGDGIPAGDLPRVTERFFQGERKDREKERGSGLGLAIVKHLVKLMGGQLSIQSKEGQGTTAKVILPAVTGED